MENANILACQQFEPETVIPIPPFTRQVPVDRLSVPPFSSKCSLKSDFLLIHVLIKERYKLPKYL